MNSTLKEPMNPLSPISWAYSLLPELSNLKLKLDLSILINSKNYSDLNLSPEELTNIVKKLISQPKKKLKMQAKKSKKN